MDEKLITGMLLALHRTVIYCLSNKYFMMMLILQTTYRSSNSKPPGRNLGVHADSDVTLSTHVGVTVSVHFAEHRQIRIGRRSLTRDVLITLIRALFIIKVGYCNSVQAGVLSAGILSRRRSVNAAARLIFMTRKSDHKTQVLKDLIL